jgi:phosphate transport system protein
MRSHSAEWSPKQTSFVVQRAEHRDRRDHSMATGSEATPGGDWDAERISLGRHFIRDLEGLWGGALKLAGVVEEALTHSVRALCDGRADLASQVKGEERAIDRWEVQIERECLKVLALHQPVASDLRRVAAVLKINRDLERISDLARNIARRVQKLAVDDPGVFPIPQELEIMALEALEQVRNSLDALTNSDANGARAVIASDGRVDRHYRVVLKELKSEIRRDPDRLNTWFRLINTARNLERIADHASNIAEAVIYFREGDIIRHVFTK